MMKHALRGSVVPDGTLNIEVREPGDQINRWAILFGPPGFMVAALHQEKA
jgi:hypothetical protein